MKLDYPTIIGMISQVIWPMGRIGGLLLTLPVFSSGLLPHRIKIILLIVLSWVCAFMVPKELSFLNFNGFFLAYIIQELLYGLLMGFVLQLVFQIFVLGGQIIAMQAGLSFAVMMDPASRASVPLVSQLYSIMMTLIFLALNGHLTVFEALLDSFRIMPVGQLSVTQSMVWNVILFSGWMFKQAVLISIPALLSLLIVSLAFGIMSRAAPQLNIFSLGFPITLIMGIVVIKVGLPSVAIQMVDLIKEGMRFITGMLH
ncbi:flagellar biosynthetic protein FliR [Legionella parisiensis]|uniref:Flagellar biosynthetic protein FliR n=1 Tax=Legionella parisiensis TaxID=45071 RepID=A0A1E5JLN1_9GAMM|nr:flagellar biosynthetic protein FliR [Legionella parisiensis]KTD41625.1 flagellar biosynthetic protein fliR [Legionella parisiensis]OEH45429.1 Flagellar biosynthetic protein FliR [Legionella parisiensis]STX76057.1 flagellar biosynthetic protein FliR [Legionella parisiensis]